MSKTLCLVWLVSAAGLGFACGNGGTEESIAERKPAPSSSSEGVIVTGKVPQQSRSALSIVSLIPEFPLEVPVSEQPRVMDQLGRAFVPELVVTRVGQPVEWRNSEIDLHNVRVIETDTGDTVMNVAMLMGVIYRQSFELDGIYSVQCDIHSSMFADVVVTSAPFSTVTDRNGVFSIPNVPPGLYTLTVQYGDQRIDRKVTINESSEPLVIEGST